MNLRTQSLVQSSAMIDSPQQARPRNLQIISPIHMHLDESPPSHGLYPLRDQGGGHSMLVLKNSDTDCSLNKARNLDQDGKYGRQDHQHNASVLNPQKLICN